MTTRLLTLRDRLELVEARLDAARRKCSTGYACGSTCINVKKECRSEGGAAISKERISRLEQLARGEVKPRGLGVPKPAEAQALAEQLRGARGSRAQELQGQRKATRAAKAEEAAKAAEAARAAEKAAKAARAAEEAAKAKQPAGAAGKDNPRAKAETVDGSGDYEFARNSAIQNAGEDIALSARHRRNMFRTIEEAEASGQIEKILTRDNLLKNFPTDLVSGVTPENVLGRLEAHYCLRAFPNLPAKEIDAYLSASALRELNRQNMEATTGRKQEAHQTVDAKTARRQYFEAFQAIRQFVEDNKDAEPGTLRRLLQGEIGILIDKYRKSQGTGFKQEHADPFNPTANALIDMYNRLRTGGKATVYGQLNEFSKAFASTGGMDKADPRGTIERMVEPATRIMEGASLNEAFGQKGANGKWRFSAADRYVGHARREGGRKVGGTPQAATDEIIKVLGFRGLQYGNSVTDDERAHHVQKAAEALVDLADAIGLPDSAIGLNGTLALAIGARGRGGAVAHYEPDLRVINLTRKNGVGSLSHEWGHALDNYASGGAKGTGFLSDYHGSPEKRQVMADVVNAWSSSGYVRQCHETLRAMKRANGLINEKYWLSHVEMFARSFEAYVSLKLAKAGRSNTYLTRELHDGGMTKGNAEGNADVRNGDGLWPTRQQAEAMEPMFDALMARLRQDDFPGPTNRNDSRDERIWRFMHAMAGAR